MRTTSSPLGTRRWRDERGAILVHVAVAFTGLLAFSALSIDLGVLWAARRQAQNVADSAAMAAAVSLAYVGADEDHARAAAKATAQAHTIWGETAPEPDVLVGPCPTGSPSASGVCVQATVERSDETGSPLPAYISRLFGFSSTGLRASASAKVLRGNATGCLKPIAIPDRWTDSDGDEVFDHFVDMGGAAESVLIANPEPYDPPGPLGAGTGYSFANVGDEIQLEVPVNLTVPLADASLFLLELPAMSPTGDLHQDFNQNMAGCPDLTVSIGDSLTAGVHAGWTAGAFQELMDADPTAEWDGTRVVNSSAPILSPRIISVALFDPIAYRQENRLGVRVPLVVRNIVGLFVLGVVGPYVNAVIIPMPGTYDSSSTELAESASFLRTIALVR